MIHVENKWYIDIDKYSYILQKYEGKKHDKKTGEEIDQWNNQKYYSTLKKALYGYYGVRAKEILKDKDINVYEALETLNKYYKDIDDKLNKILREEEV